eukprot:g9555.t1
MSTMKTTHYSFILFTLLIVVLCNVGMCLQESSSEKIPVEPVLDGEYIKKNVTIDPEHLKSRLEKVIENDSSSYKRDDRATTGLAANRRKRELLSSRQESLKVGSQQTWGRKRRKKAWKSVKGVAKKATSHVTKAATAVKTHVTKAAITAKKHVTKAVHAVKTKFNTNNDVSWEEPAAGTKFGLAMPGGGVKSVFAMWQILLEHGFHILKNAPMVSTNSGSSWAINQLLFSKKDYFMGGPDKAKLEMEELLDDILEASSNSGTGDDAFNLMTGMIPNIFHKAGPNWLEHMLQASHVKDGWNRMVDDINHIVKVYVK